MPKFYMITEADGRVKRDLPDGTRVLVGTPGKQISWALAVELGLVGAPKAEAGKVMPAKEAKAAKKAAASKKAEEAESDEDDEAKPAPRLSNYPTKKSSG